MKLVFILMTACLMATSNASSLRRAKEEPQEKVLAKIELDDTSVSFVQDGPGVIVTAGASDKGAKALEAALSEIDDDESTVVDVWKALSGDEVPKALQEAADRMRRSPVEPAPQGNEDESDDAVVPDVLNSKAKGLSCNDFESSHCFHTNKSVCWSCRTGSGNLWKYTNYMYSKVNVYRGTITQRLQVKDCSSCGWRTVQTKSVKQGWNWYQWAQNYSAVQAKVDNGTGDGYHWTIYWT